MAETGRRARWRGWFLGALAALVATASLVAGSAFGTVSKKTLNPRLIAWISAATLLIFGVIATTRLSRVLARRISDTSVPAAGGAVRIISAAVGYLIVIFAVLAELKVSIEHLLVGAGLAGIVLGIAAQQSLGNVFAGIVLLATRPFHVGDRVRVRSGSLGGIFDARVREMALTYVTLQTEEGEYKVPNSAMLAAGVARTPRTPLPQTGAAAAPAKPAGPAAPVVPAAAVPPPGAADGAQTPPPGAPDGAQAPAPSADERQ